MGPFFYMRISTKDLQRCISKVREVTEVYDLHHLDAHANVRLVDVLEEMAHHVTGRPVNVYYLDESASERHVKGVCVVLDERCDILILDGLNFCWGRFVLCKELFHAFLDCDEYRNMDLEKHLESMFTLFQVDPDSTDKTTDAEILAEIAAMEFLFPLKTRQRCIERGMSVAEMAQQYKVPELLLERYTLPANMNMLEKYCAP